ncbi:CHAT domain-containing protein [Neolewinella persica]|uniref:CHAT domain-containing protein n=1 Tax=Neolewinella persica TaxID=70998 RepID=UPI00037E0065|nr:CHAT domain-containing protein [Neolewinella persica]
MPNNLITLVSEARLDEALEVLKQHPKFGTDRRFQNSVIMISAQLNSSMDQQNKMLISMDTAMRQKAQISQSILEIARMHDIEDTGNVGATIPPPIPKEDQKADALRILFLASDPREVGRLNLEKEYVKIRTQLGDNAPDFNLNIMFEQRPDTLIKTLLEEKPTYIHFAGHGDKGTKGFSPAGIVLQDRDRNPKVVSGPALANMFRLLKREFEIKVVLLNACDSVDQARAISGNGIHAIGMAKEIPDNMAITFAGGFYLGLAEAPDDIPRAFDYALASLMMEGYDIDAIPRLFFNKEEVDLSAG